MNTLEVVYSCTGQRQQEIKNLVSNEEIAEIICRAFDCSISAASCVLAYLATKQEELSEAVGKTAKSEVSLSLDIAYMLFSAYLVFGPMQLGFALVSVYASGA